MAAYFRSFYLTSLAFILIRCGGIFFFLTQKNIPRVVTVNRLAAYPRFNPSSDFTEVTSSNQLQLIACVKMYLRLILNQD